MGHVQKILDTMYSKNKTYLLRAQHTCSYIIAHRTPAACRSKPMKRTMNRLSIKKHKETDNLQLLAAAKGGTITRV